MYVALHSFAASVGSTRLRPAFARADRMPYNQQCCIQLPFRVYGVYGVYKRSTREKGVLVSAVCDV